jgi:hypothetical protein
LSVSKPSALIVPWGGKPQELCGELLIDYLPLVAEQVTHHLLAAGDGLGLQGIQRRGGRQLPRVEGGQIDTLEFGYLTGSVFIVDETDRYTQMGHGIPPGKR